MWTSPYKSELKQNKPSHVRARNSYITFKINNSSNQSTKTAGDCHYELVFGSQYNITSLVF